MVTVYTSLKRCFGTENTKILMIQQLRVKEIYRRYVKKAF